MAASQLQKSKQHHRKVVNDKYKGQCAVPVTYVSNPWNYLFPLQEPLSSNAVGKTGLTLTPELQ
jgi:hypothetical protein